MSDINTSGTIDAQATIDKIIASTSEQIATFNARLTSLETSFANRVIAAVKSAKAKRTL